MTFIVRRLVVAAYRDIKSRLKANLTVVVLQNCRLHEASDSVITALSKSAKESKVHG